MRHESVKYIRLDNVSNTDVPCYQLEKITEGQEPL